MALPMLQLLEVFDRAGDAIEAYGKQEKDNYGLCACSSFSTPLQTCGDLLEQMNA